MSTGALQHIEELTSKCFWRADLAVGGYTILLLTFLSQQSSTVAMSILNNVYLTKLSLPWSSYNWNLPLYDAM